MVSQFAQNDINKCNEIARSCPHARSHYWTNRSTGSDAATSEEAKSGLFPMFTR
jgi:hypothetical protein